MLYHARRLMARSAHFVLASGVLLGACSPRAAGQANSAIGTSNNFEESQPELDKAERQKTAKVTSTAVVEAGRPFTGYRAMDGSTFQEEDLLTTLAAADGICIGERHDSPLDHYAQLRTIRGLSERRTIRGFELGLALEMVRIEKQLTLESYQNQLIDDDEFEIDSNWKTEWGYSIELYYPQLRALRAGGGSLLALGVERSFTRAVALKGLKHLSSNEKRALPEIDSTNGEHRELFDTLMSGHPSGNLNLDNYYEAQLLWDEQMAETSATWLTQRYPGRKIIILAGTAHCHHSAIPSRIERRTGLTIVSLLPVEGGSPLESNGPESSPEELLAQGYDYQMVFQR